MVSEIWHALFGNGEEIQLESFPELRDKITNFINEEVDHCTNYPELGQHITRLGSKLGEIAHIKDEDMNALFEVIKSLPPLPDASPFIRIKEFEDLINSIK